jgi:hypothetical protein
MLSMEFIQSIDWPKWGFALRITSSQMFHWIKE